MNELHRVLYLQSKTREYSDTIEKLSKTNKAIHRLLSEAIEIMGNEYQDHNYFEAKCESCGCRLCEFIKKYTKNKSKDNDKMVGGGTDNFEISGDIFL
jgi:hypothetical protein